MADRAFGPVVGPIEAETYIFVRVVGVAPMGSDMPRNAASGHAMAKVFKTPETAPARPCKRK